MPIVAKFLIKVESERVGEVSQALSNFNFKVFDTRFAGRVGETGNNVDNGCKLDKESLLVCEMKLAVHDVNKAFSLQNTLKSIRGVSSIDLPMYDWEEPTPAAPPAPPKLHWYERKFMPIIVSTIITAITVTYAVFHIKSVLDPQGSIHLPEWEIALIIGVPTVINFLFQYHHKYHPHDHSV